MQDVRTGHNRVGRRRRGALHLDGLLLVLLVLGWLLIFTAASMAVRRNPQRWLRVNLVPQLSADYSVDASEAPRLAPVRPQIVEAVKRDALVGTSPESSDALVEATPEQLPLLVFGPTRTPTIVPSDFLTPTLGPGPAQLIVKLGGPFNGEEGSPILLDARGASLAPGAISYRWDLDHDNKYDDAVGDRARVIFYDEGEYLVGVQATDAVGRVTTTTAIINVSNVAPTVYGVRDMNAREGERISFSASVTDPGHDVLIYAWDFGDGATATGTLKPDHIYLDNGDYTVRFRAEDNDGGVTEAHFVTRVANLPPNVDAGPDQVLNEGATARFRARATDEGRYDTLSYAWDLDYDGVTFRPDAYGPSVSKVYPDGPAEMVAAVRVRDKDGGQALDTLQVRVNNLAPTMLGVSDDGPVGEGAPLTLTVDARDVHSDTLKYVFDWENDGQYDAESQSPQVPHVWYDEGEYTVGLLVDDMDGGQVYSTTVVTVYNLAPTAVAGSALTQFEGATVTLDGSLSSDPGIYDVLAYEWDFGDGSPVVNVPVAQHAYADNGVYSATLRVADGTGAADTDGVTVSIVNANPLADAGGDRTVNEGDTLNLTGMASDPGAGDTLAVAWDLDYDGVTFDEDVVGTTTVDIDYDDGPARYAVAFRVRDDDYPFPPESGGQVGEAIDVLEVVVDNIAPVADAGGSYEAKEGDSITLTGTGRDVPADRLRYEWDLDGDGSFEQTGASVSGVWTSIGEYQVTLRVTDDDGGVGLDTAQVRIGNGRPTAEAGGPYDGDEGSPIVLTGAGSDPTNDPLTYSWDLDYDSVFEQAGQVVTNTWADDGVYTVTLRVDDGRGGVDTDDAVVTVKNLPPIADAGGPYLTTTGITLTLTATATDVPSDTLIYTWDLDHDGAFDDGAGQSVSYVWNTTGVYTVAVQVDDGDGGVVTAETRVNVNMLVPVAGLGAYSFLVRSKKSIFRNRNLQNRPHDERRWDIHLS